MSKSNPLLPPDFDSDTASKCEIARLSCELLHAAENGDHVADALLGYWYQIGLGFESDLLKSMSHYARAANAGIACAAYNLAQIYYVDRRFEEAAHWLHIGSQNGDSQSSALLGSMYEAGRGVKYDIEKALEYYRRGASAGNRDAILHLVSCVRRGITEEMSLKSAEAQLRMLARDDDPKYWYELALFTAEANAGSHDPIALEHCEKAAQLGFGLAEQWCGEAYCMGQGCEEDLKKGMCYLSRAVEKGLARAKYVKAVLLAVGRGVEKDVELAYTYCLEAAEAGEIDAMKMIALMLRRGLGVDQDEPRAIEWERAVSTLSN